MVIGDLNKLGFVVISDPETGAVAFKFKDTDTAKIHGRNISNMSDGNTVYGVFTEDVSDQDINDFSDFVRGHDFDFGEGMSADEVLLLQIFGVPNIRECPENIKTFLQTSLHKIRSQETEINNLKEKLTIQELKFEGDIN